jgi:hypothetical protein
MRQPAGSHFEKERFGLHALWEIDVRFSPGNEKCQLAQPRSNGEVEECR